MGTYREPQKLLQSPPSVSSSKGKPDTSHSSYHDEGMEEAGASTTGPHGSAAGGTGTANTGDGNNGYGEGNGGVGKGKQGKEGEGSDKDGDAGGTSAEETECHAVRVQAKS